MQHSIFSILTFTHTPIAFMLSLIKPNLVEKGAHTPRYPTDWRKSVRRRESEPKGNKAAMKERKSETERKSTRYDMIKMNGLLSFETGMNERNAHTREKKVHANKIKYYFSSDFGRRCRAHRCAAATIK